MLFIDNDEVNYLFNFSNKRKANAFKLTKQSLILCKILD